MKWYKDMMSDKNIAKSKKNSFSKLPHPRFVSMRDLPEVASWRALMEAFRVTYSFLEKGLVSDGWSMPRFQIILILYFEGPQSQSQLSRRFLVTRGNISAFCKRLQNDGLITPVKGVERKRPPFALTAKGAKLFEEIFPKHIKRIQSRMPIFKEESLEQLHGVAESGSTSLLK